MGSVCFWRWTVFGRWLSHLFATTCFARHLCAATVWQVRPLSAQLFPASPATFDLYLGVGAACGPQLVQVPMIGWLIGWYL